jgi:AcrR family transcriptional regulator
MGGSTLRERQRQLREDAILDAAHELIVEQGYGEMSMDDVAARVGVSKATLYQHFPSKEDLVLSVILRSMRRGEESMTAGNPASPALDRLEQVLRQGILRRASLWSARHGTTPISLTRDPRFQAQHDRLVGAVSELVDAAKAEGDIAQELPTPIIVRMILSLFRGDYDDVLTSGTCSLAEVSNALVSIMLNGIRTRNPGNKGPA